MHVIFFVPETWTHFGDLTVFLLLQHLWTVLSPVGRHLDDEAFPRLLPHQGVTS